jgi:hypothetical protein
MRLALVLAAATLAGPALAGPALAQERPVMVPSKDTTVDYQMEGRSGGPRSMRMMYSAGGKMIRIDMPGQKGYVVMNRDAHRMMIVMAEAHRYMEHDLPPGQRDPFDMGNGQKFTKKGTETIAGMRCTVWEATGEHPGNGCVTDDGIVLRGESAPPNGEKSRLIATAVSVAPIAPDMFAAPTGFAKMDIPSMPAGARPGAPRP